MKTPDQIIDEALGILDPVEDAITNNKITVPKTVVKSDEDDIDNDYKYQRENFYNLVERGQDAIEGILELAKESEHPRAFEVVAQTLKNLGELNKDLLEIQKRKQDLEPKKSTNEINVDKAVFVGSTNDLVKMLKGKKDVN